MLCIACLYRGSSSNLLLFPLHHLYPCRCSTFWITNPNNYFIGNVAAGCVLSGFWFEEPKQDPVYLFKDNVAHNNMNAGINRESCIFVAVPVLSIQPLNLTLTKTCNLAQQSTRMAIRHPVLRTSTTLRCTITERECL